jgi:intracellular sulfur oxidation DsrE/DsrF family protein
MENKGISSAEARRLFLGRFGTGLGVIGAAVAAGTTASAQSGDQRFQPARHEQDDWFEKVPGKHRFVFDTTSPDGFSNGLTFATNFFEANKSSYGLSDSDLAVVIVVRHKSTAFAYNDGIWAKYSVPLAEQVNNFVDPATKAAPVINIYGTPGGNGVRPGRLDALLKRGVNMAVCQMATRAISGALARATNGNADDVYKELTSNLVANAHMVPAGIVAVNRAQERGYTFVTTG